MPDQKSAKRAMNAETRGLPFNAKRGAAPSAPGTDKKPKRTGGGEGNLTLTRTLTLPLAPTLSRVLTRTLTLTLTLTLTQPGGGEDKAEKKEERRIPLSKKAKSHSKPKFSKSRKRSNR